MNSRQDRYSLMLEHGLNVPDYVINPSTAYKEDTVTFLKERFFGCPYLTFLAKKEGVVKEYDEEALRDAFQKSVVLEQSGYTVWIVEGFICEYTGTLWARKDGSGKFKYRNGAKKKVVFTDSEDIKNLREKIIARRVVSFAQKAKFDAVMVDFGWASSFLGKLNERIVFFDFLPLKDFC